MLPNTFPTPPRRNNHGVRKIVGVVCGRVCRFTVAGFEVRRLAGGKFELRAVEGTIEKVFFCVITDDGRFELITTVPGGPPHPAAA